MRRGNKIGPPDRGSSWQLLGQCRPDPQASPRQSPLDLGCFAQARRLIGSIVGWMEISQAGSAETRRAVTQTGKVCRHESHVLVILVAEPKQGPIQWREISRSAQRYRYLPRRHESTWDRRLIESQCVAFH